MRGINHGKVSVIIPVYNVFEYLEKCVDSVAAQTYADLEIWLVDDGSTDGSGKLCDEFAVRDERVRVIHQENKGPSGARNAALDNMTGEYVTFVDADDHIHEQMVEKLIRSLVSNKADVSFCGIMEVMNGTDGGRSVDPDMKSGGETVFEGDLIYESLFDEKYRRTICAACAKIYKRRIFDKIRFPLGRIHEDEYTIHRILGLCDRLVILKEGLYYHFIHPGSLTQRVYSLRSLDAVEAMEDRCRYFEELGNKRFVMLSYRDYLRRVQFHFYSLKKYFPKEKEKSDHILFRYKYCYSKISKELKVFERLRYGLFIYFPGLNRMIKAAAGARRI